MWLLSELAMCANLEDTLGYMGSCRILCNTHVPCLKAKEHNFLFGITPLILLSLFKLLILVASTRHAALNLACLLEVGQQA